MTERPELVSDYYSWLKYAQSLDQKNDIFAKFIISYMALCIYASKAKLNSFKHEIDIIKFEARFIANIKNLNSDSHLKKAIKEYIDYFDQPGVQSLRYPAYYSSEDARELKHNSDWSELGNALYYVKLVRNNLIHGGKKFDDNQRGRDYIVVRLAQKIIEGLFEDVL